MLISELPTAGGYGVRVGPTLVRDGGDDGVYGGATNARQAVVVTILKSTCDVCIPSTFAYNGILAGR